jgi:hypothetical protein
MRNIIVTLVLFAFCAAGVFTQDRPATDTGTLILDANAPRVSIYSETELYEVIANSTKLATITRELNPGEWTIDNGYDEKKVIIRTGTTMRVTLKAIPDLGERTDQRMTIVDSKTKNPPEWLITYITNGNRGIDNRANYADRMSFVSQIDSSHPVNDIYLQHLVLSQVFSGISEKVSDAFNKEIDRADTFNRIVERQETRINGYSREFSATHGAFESHAIIVDAKSFNAFLKSLDYRKEESWWCKGSSKHKKGNEETYTGYLLSTISKPKFYQAVADEIKALVNNNPDISVAERLIYEDFIRSILE